jgi:hypothetical protein
MSNHLHEVLTDTRGKLSRFFALRTRALANVIKVLRGLPGEVFEKRPANWVELRSAESVLQQTAYTITNCVAAGLVRTPHRWPGAKVMVEDLGRRIIRVKRPTSYLDANNPKWPDEVELAIAMPPQLEQVYDTHDACRAALRTRVCEMVRKAHASHQGRGYPGAKRVLRTPHTWRASSFEPFGSLTPNFAYAGDRALKETLVAERHAFLNDYRKAWRAWKAGDHDAVFPYGTWKMHVVYGARRHPPPS